jgi:hypothetical protein
MFQPKLEPNLKKELGVRLTRPVECGIATRVTADTLSSRTLSYRTSLLYGETDKCFLVLQNMFPAELEATVNRLNSWLCFIPYTYGLNYKSLSS